MAAIDYYNTDDNNGITLGGATWRGQTFTASDTYSISSVKLLLYKSGTPGTVTVSIRAVDGTGKPTGDDLCSGTTDGDTLPGNVAPYEWREITFSAAYSLISGTQYAIVVRSSGSSLGWRRDTTAPSYAGGQSALSSNSGGTWTLTSTIDYMFETYGTSITTLGLAGTIAGTSSLTGAVTKTTITPTSLAGIIAAQSSVSGALTLWTVTHLSLSGTIAALSSVLGYLTKRMPAPAFPPARTGAYDEDSVWDEDTGTWGSDEALLKAGGSRYRAQLIVVGKDLIYYEEVT